MPKFNHAYDFAFEVRSERDDAEDVTPAMIRAALLERVNRLTDEELIDAANWYDSYEEN
jgi:hypothetical protein